MPLMRWHAVAHFPQVQDLIADPDGFQSTGMSVSVLPDRRFPNARISNQEVKELGDIPRYALGISF